LRELGLPMRADKQAEWAKKGCNGGAKIGTLSEIPDVRCNLCAKPPVMMRRIVPDSAVISYLGRVAKPIFLSPSS